MKKYLLPIILIFLGITRFLYLSEVPPGMSNDEIEYATSAKSYALYSHDISGSGFPDSFFETNTDGVISPVAPLLLSVLLKFLQFNQITIRAIYVLINFLTAFFIFHLARILFGKENKYLDLLTVILFLLNPWSLYLSRVSVDVPFALLFYLAGITYLLKFNGKKLLIPFVLFILAFFSYHGGKFIFLPVVFVSILYKGSIEKVNILRKKEYAAFLAASVVFVIAFLIKSSMIPGSDVSSRYNDLFFSNKEKITATVDGARRQAMQNPLNFLFINKLTLTLKTFSNQYLAAFSPEVLFIGGDFRSTYRFGEHGLFYLIDIILITFGFAALYSKNKKVCLYLASLALIAPIATGVSNVEVSVINRSFLLLPVLVIFSAYGLSVIIKILLTQKKLFKISGLLVTLLVILLSFLNFYNFYFYRLPVLSQENYWLSERVLIKYLGWISEDIPVLVVTDRPRSTYLRYSFYTYESNKNNFPRIGIPFNANIHEYKLNNIIFTDACPAVTGKDGIFAVSSKLGCNINQKPDFVITDQKDSGALIDIYNSKICEGVSKDNWRRFNTMSQYTIEKLDYNTFCTSWIFKP